MGVVLLALRRDYAMKIDPCRMLVWIGRAGPVRIQIYYGPECNKSKIADAGILEYSYPPLVLLIEALMVLKV